MKKGQEMTRQSVEKIFSGMTDLLVKKNQDYHGASFDLGLQGNFVHIWDKVSRLKHLFENRSKGQEPNFEGIEDTYRDIIGYCVIGLHILAAEQKGGKEDELDQEELLNKLASIYPSASPTLIEDIVRKTREFYG